MTKEQVLAAFPIGSKVKPKDGMAFYGGKATGMVAGVSGYQMTRLSGIRYMVWVVDDRGSLLGEYHPHELKQA